MTAGEDFSWERPWGGSAEAIVRPKPEHDSDMNEVVPSNSEPARVVDPRRIGEIVTGPDRPITWD